MDFNLKDLNSGEAVTAHQTFIRLTHIETQQEIFFVAEPNSNDHYTFTLDVSATAKDSFNHQSGKYKMVIKHFLHVDWFWYTRVVKLE